MKYIYFVLILFFSVNVFAQSEMSSNSPTVMVIPFVKEGENMRSVYEQDSLSHLRVAMSIVKSGFDTTQIKTVDLHGVLRQMNFDKVMESEQQLSIKQQVIALSGVDIYVEVEAQKVLTEKGNSVTVILSAYDAFSGRSIANNSHYSPKFYTQNFEKLAEKALNKFLNKFIAATQVKYNDISKNGSMITVNIGIAENATLDMDSEIGNSGNLLSDILEDWFDENTYEAQYNIQGITTTKMIIKDIRIPQVDENDKKKFRPSKFGRALRKYLTSIGVENVSELQGNNIFITIQ